MWHCLLAALRLTPGASFEMVLELLGPREAAGEMARCVVAGSRGRWGESTFLVHRYFLIESEPSHGDFRLIHVGGQNPLAGIENFKSRLIYFLFISLQ